MHILAARRLAVIVAAGNTARATANAVIARFNVDAAELTDEALRTKLSALVAPAEAIFLDAKTEAELAELPDEDALESFDTMYWSFRYLQGREA